jgi:hypothetical protein
MRACYHELMKALWLAAAALLVLGCSSPGSRIKKNQAVFDSFPPEAQAKVRQGKAAVGMTPEMVRIALGKPDRVYTRATPQGEQEIWAYGGDRRGGPSVGLGLGIFSGSPTVYGGSVGVGTSDLGVYEDRERVVFEKGSVVSVERRES